MTRRSDSFRARLVACLLPALQALPARRANRLLDALGASGLALNRGRRERIGGLVSRAAQTLGCRWPTRSTTLGWAGNTLRWHARDLLLDRLSTGECDGLIEVEGREHLDAALAAKRGVVLLFNHFGPFLIHTHWMVRHGYSLRWFTERPRRISARVAETFETTGPLGQSELFLSRRMTPSEGASAVRRAIQMLRSGMIVQAAGDVRWQGARCATGRFLGREHRFTTTWISLAARSGALVVPTAARMNHDGSYRVTFQPALAISEASVEPANARALVQQNLDRVEGLIRDDPTNCGDYLYWFETEARGRSA